jgi:hypothetical protein
MPFDEPKVIAIVNINNNKTGASIIHAMDRTIN